MRLERLFRSKRVDHEAHRTVNDPITKPNDRDARQKLDGIGVVARICCSIIENSAGLPDPSREAGAIRLPLSS